MIDIKRVYHLQDGDIKRLADNKYDAVIAVNDDVGDGYPIDIRSMDIDTYLQYGSVCFAHEIWKLPVGNSERLYFDDRGRLHAVFEFTRRDKRAAEVKNSWDQGHIKAASISARPVESDQGPYSSYGKPPEGTRHRLVEWSIVTVPADVDAVNNGRQRSLVQTVFQPDNGGIIMTKEEREGIVRELKDELKGSQNEGLASRLESLIKDMEAKDADQALEERLGKIIDDKLEAVGLTRAAGAQGAGGEGEGAGTGEGTQGAQGAGQGTLTQEDVEKRASARVALLRQVDGLLPDGFDTTGKTDKEILVAAVGDEVENAADRSEDYLLGRIEEIAQRRAAASQGTPGIGTGNGTEAWQSGSRAMNAVDLKRMESQKKAS